MAGLPLSAVGVERAIEPAALTVDVDVQGVEGRAALRQGLGHDVDGVLEQPIGGGCAQAAGRKVVVEARSPQGLVRVDVAHPRYQGLIQQAALDARVPAAQCPDNGGAIEEGIERIPRDVGHRRRHASTLAVIDEVVDMEPAESTLIDEAQFAIAVVEPDAHAQVRTVVVTDFRKQQLPAHAEVGDKCAAVIEREPEVLPAPTGSYDSSSVQVGGECTRAARIAPD